MEYTGERFLPEVKGPETSCEHWHRYLYASQYAHGRTVLDIACGEGYGAYLLAETARRVVGIDNSRETIRHAASKYLKANLKFAVGDAGEIPIEGSATFDLVVSFETIEHLQEVDQRRFLTEVKRLLKPGGLFIVSTPNKLAYSDLPGYHNPFHTREFYIPEFEDLLLEHFPQVEILGQRIYPISYIWPQRGAQDHWTEYRLSYTESGFRPTSEAKEVVYVVAICSNRAFKASRYSVALDLSSQMLKMRDQEIERSRRSTQEKEEALRSLDAEMGRVGEQLESLRQEKQELAYRMETLRSEKDQVASQLRSLEAGRDESLRQIRDLQQERDRFASDLQAITVTYKWKAALLLGRARHWVAPDGTRREKAYRLIIRGLQLWRREGFRALLRRGSVGLGGGRDGLLQGSPRRSWRARRPGGPGLPPGRRERDRVALPPLFVHEAGETPKSLLMRPKDILPTTLSVVIPTKNAIAEGLENLLQALADQKGVATPEIVIVDSGSTDATVRLAREYSAKVIEIEPGQFNHGATRNLAAENGQGELILFMTQDAVPASEDLLHELARTLLADDLLAGVSPKQIARSDADLYACWEVVSHYRYLAQAPRTSLAHPVDLTGVRSDELRRLATLDNVCAMVRRSVWNQVRFRPTDFAEDLQFGVDCLRLGYRTALLSHRAVIHSHTRSPSYILAKHYVDKLVLSRILNEVPEPWIDSLDLGQLVAALRGLHWTVARFARDLNEAETYDPSAAMRRLSDRLHARPALPIAATAPTGDPDLDGLLGKAADLFVGDYPPHDPSIGALRGKLDAIAGSLEGRYPEIDGAELSSLLLKAFSGTAGRLLGEYCYGRSLRGRPPEGASQLDALLVPSLRTRK